MRTRVFFAFYFFLLSFLFIHSINASDFYHHLNTGRYVASHLSLPYYDDLSFTANGNPWVAYAWGSGLIFFVIHQVFGQIGISILFAILGTLASFFLYLTLRNLRIQIPIALILVFLAASLISLRWPTRPEVLGPLFIVALIYFLTSYNRFAKMIPLFFWLWAIMYGSSVFLGILVLGFYFVTQRLFTKKSLIIFVASVIASLLNGYGLRSFLYIFQIPAIAPHVGEWLPLTTALNPQIPELVLFYQYPALVYGLFVFFSGIVLIGGFIKTRSVIFSNLFFLGIALAIAAPFYTNRFMNLSPLLTIPILAIIINQYAKNWRLVCLSLGLLLALSVTVVRYYNLGFPIGGDQFHNKAINFLKEKDINGNIFASQELGAYISWELPKSKVFVDTRDDLYQPVGIFDELRKLDEGKIDIITLLDTYKADIVLADIANGRVYRPLLYHQDWSMVYVTDGFFIAARKTLKEKHNLEEFDAIDPLRIPPAKPGTLEEAEKELEKLLQSDPASIENQVRQVELKLALNKPQEAKSILEDLNLATHFGSRQAVEEIANGELAGKVYLANHECDKAFQALSKADKSSYGKLIFSPQVRLPTAVDRLLGDYYNKCTNDTLKAKKYFLKYLENNKNPLERRDIERKLELIDNKVL